MTAVAPLRSRRDDVLPLAMQLLSARCKPGERIPALSAEAAQLLLTYGWPGNVRELDNLLQRALILLNGPVIGPDHIQFELANETPVYHEGAAAPGTAGALTHSPNGSLNHSLANSLDQTERELILDALRTGQGNRREVAERLGISQRTLRYKLARLREAGIDVPAA